MVSAAEHVVQVGAATFRYRGEMPAGLRKLLAGKAPPRGRIRPPAKHVTIGGSPERAYRDAMITGRWAPPTQEELQGRRVDATVAAASSIAARIAGGIIEEVHHMPTTITKPKPTARKRSTRKPLAKPTATAPRGLTALAAAEQVLRKADGPMRVSEIAAKAVKLRAFHTTGVTPEASVASRVHVSAKSGGVFVRVDRGIVDLRELNPKGRKARPTSA